MRQLLFVQHFSFLSNKKFLAVRQMSGNISEDFTKVSKHNHLVICLFVFCSLGDPINPGDLLCDIQTDKAVVSMDTEEEGIMAKILVRMKFELLHQKCVFWASDQV